MITKRKNILKYSFVNIIHTNRNSTSVDRMKHAGDMLYETSSDVKDSGNIAEDCDYLFTIMNPNDEKYNLNKHFGTVIKSPAGNPLYPNMRTVHLVESRHTQYPQHFKTNMLGNLKAFKELKTR